MNFTKNMGSTDRIIRILIALIIGILYFTDTISGVVGGVLLIIGVILLLTGFIAFCPIYKPFGIRTNSQASKKA